MKKINVDLLREISKTKSKFISITIIMFLGVFVFAGLKETPPTMRNTLNHYFQEVNMYDLQIKNELGIDEKAVEIIKNNQSVETYEAYFKNNADLEGFSSKVELISIPTKIAKAKVVLGRMPQTNNEIVLVESMKENYKIGDKLKFSYKNDTNYVEKEFEIVGFVYGATFPDAVSGNKASRNYFAYVKEDNLISKHYSGINIVLKDINRTDFSSNTYYDEVNKVKNELILKFNDKRTLDFYAFKQKTDDELRENRDQLNQSKNQIAQSEKEIESLKQISLSKYEEALNEINQNKSKLVEQEEELDLAKKQLDSYTYPAYQLLNIKDNSMYRQFIDSMNSLMSIANLFSIFLFSVSILVTLATISRMVEENRINIGTLKSLGFSNQSIARKYYVYGMISALSGGILGLIASYFVIVPLVYNAYARFLTFKHPIITATKTTLILSLLIVVACVLLAVYIPISKILKEKAAYLLRPKAPKKATRILLEYMPLIWSKLSFLKKVTFRNIFRYKVRMLMTIFGVMGSLALMFIGFGIMDGVKGIASEQFQKINAYQFIASYNPYMNKKDLTELDYFIQNHSGEYKKINLSTATIEKDNTVLDRLSIYTFDSNLEPYVSLYHQDSNIEMNDNGVVISEKLAYLYHIKIGDKLEVYWNQKKYFLDVAAINTNYFGHNLYMNKGYYERIFNQDYQHNSYLLKTSEDNAIIEKELQSNDKILSIQNTSQYIELLENVVRGIDTLVIVMIACSVSLALVVLFNLININVSERTRELSTIKVLGFYPKEITTYIFREIFYLGLIGIGIGNYIGYLLYKKIILELAGREMLFRSNLSIEVYGISSFITILILLVLMLMVHRSLKSINMIEALKGVE